MGLAGHGWAFREYNRPAKSLAFQVGVAWERALVTPTCRAKYDLARSVERAARWSLWPAD